MYSAGGGRLGFPRTVLALALPEARDRQALAAARRDLAAWAEEVAFHLCLEAHGGGGLLVRQELAEERGLGNVCEASGVFLHELGNSLNVLLFELAILERKSPEELRGSLAGLREVGRDIACQMQELRSYEDSQRTAVYAVDLNAVVRAAADEGLTVWAAPATLTLEANLPAVLATVADVQRLLRLLVGVAARVPEARPPLELQTRRAAEGVQLRLCWAGPESAEPPTLPQVQEVQFAWPVCQRLVRRLRGVLRLEPQPSGGALCVDLAAASA